MSQSDLGTGPGLASLDVSSDDARTRTFGPDDVTMPSGPRRSAPALGPHANRPLTTLVRVLLCEDQEVFRLGLRIVLEAQPDMAVVAETAHSQGHWRPLTGS